MEQEKILTFREQMIMKLNQTFWHPLKDEMKNVKMKFPSWFKEFTGHDVENVHSLANFIKWMHTEKDAASLGVFRMLFGIAMLIDIPEERAGGSLDLRFGEPRHCHFPLFDFIKPLGLPQMGIVYLIMWLGSLGIALGYKFKISCLMFLIPYWYVFLLDKPAWNNHSYLYGLCGLLLFTTNANRFCSIDNWKKSPGGNQTVPFWNYFIVKYQFFILYFVAGLKKMTVEWLSGYSMTNLGYHWVFIPFRLFLSVEMIELLIIHWFIAFFDLTIAFWMTHERTRLWALPFMISFHLMNSRLFVIGMFPWVCLAELPLFFNVDWPRKVVKLISSKFRKVEKEKHECLEYKTESTSEECLLKKSKFEQKKLKNNQEIRKRKTQSFSEGETLSNEKLINSNTEEIQHENQEKTKLSQNLRIILILFYCFLQLFLPYSHFITKGYNNWTNGIYGYSWDMMVHSYDTILTSIKVVDNKNGKVHYLEPYAFSEYDRWTKHADMAKQYANCIERNLIEDYENNPRTLLKSNNFSIYFDVWCSMNSRFQQRVFDPRVDILKAKWSPFETSEWVLPLLNELNYMRPKINTITQDVLAWSNYSDVMFIADFPELTMENFISPDLDNVTLTVLEGTIKFQLDTNETENDLKKDISLSFGQSIPVTSGEFHLVSTISDSPSCYMYTYSNRTMKDLNIHIQSVPDYSNKPYLPLWKEISDRLQNYKQFFYHIGNSLMFLVYGVPMPVRLRERE